MPSSQCENGIRISNRSTCLSDFDFLAQNLSARELESP